MIVAAAYPDGCDATLHNDDTRIERRVVQYGPEWVAHVTAGRPVRCGNILVFEAPQI